MFCLLLEQNKGIGQHRYGHMVMPAMSVADFVMIHAEFTQM
jgi:hypothetical protein